MEELVSLNMNNYSNLEYTDTGRYIFLWKINWVYTESHAEKVETQVLSLAYGLLYQPNIYSFRYSTLDFPRFSGNTFKVAHISVEYWYCFICLIGR